MSIFDSRALLYALAVAVAGVAVAVTDVAPLDKPGNSSTGACACACCGACACAGSAHVCPRLRNELGLAWGAFVVVCSSGPVRGLDVVAEVDELKNLFFLAAPGNILLLLLLSFLVILSKCLYGLPEYK